MTKRIQDARAALALFEKAATTHAEATESGDYKTGNKAFKEIVKAVHYLRDHGGIEQLKPFLICPSVGVRTWAAAYLLSSAEKESVAVLEAIAAMPGILGFNAEMTLQEWRKGNLKMP